MSKNYKIKYLKWICPKCGKKQRWRTTITKNIDENGIIMVAGDLPFCCHEHCKRCEAALDYKDALNWREK